MNNGVWIPETKQQPNKFTSVRPNLLPGKEIFYGKTCSIYSNDVAIEGLS